MKKLALLLASAPVGALAHPGHGLEAASHWHASDAWGWIALAGGIAVALWLGRRK